MTISLCTNDEHGNDTGRVFAVHLDDAVELQWSESGTEPRYSIWHGNLRLSRKTFSIQGKTFSIQGKTDRYGNWCWTGVTMRPAEICRLLNYLSQDDRWHCEGGWCDLTDAYCKGEVLPHLLKEIA